MNPHFEFFKKIVGESHVINDANQLKVIGNDWTKRFLPAPSLAVLPKSESEVQQIVRYCSINKISIVPSGGRTGLAGGAVALNNEVVISLQRMNKIIKVDSIDSSITAEAGVTTSSLQEMAHSLGLYYPLDLASKGSSQLGGNIATNAGGLKVIRFGNLRDSVLGMRVVLANGDVLDLQRNLRKDNSGYDLKHLFIASEGTLGIITEATIKLQPKLAPLRIACLGVRSFKNVCEVLKKLNLSGLKPTAMEFFIRRALEIVTQYNSQIRDPFQDKFPFYVLLEMEENLGSDSQIETLVEKLLEENVVEDAMVSTNSAEFKNIWSLRENITESLANYGHVRKNDVALSLGRLSDFVESLEQTLKSHSTSDIEVILFGHIGDGNIHINYISPPEIEFNFFHQEAQKIEHQVFKIISQMRGSISAEHGIGLVKKEDLKFTRSPFEIELLQKIKSVFDPNGIMNPGKIF